ncbi:spore coat protein [Gracilibacillus salinarum]|uniref:Spore coat protein n=1 Tax=Gracilibacillus salinarum TaxID=2932255 RepID=A0ABY4GH83_9BACI|nr:spore coat protein [Gracilibacillus salinarum]UOQ83696.1 spore coat protein [Gracilibacillus salinarum]
MSKRKRERVINEFYGCGGYNNSAAIENTADQNFQNLQGSFESIEVRDSCDVNITSTDTQVAVSIQAALQVAIALVVNITIADSDRAELVTQELLQQAEINQVNQQRILIEGSKNVEISTLDTDVAISLQVLLQILLALLIQLDIF